MGGRSASTRPWYYALSRAGRYMTEIDPVALIDVIIRTAARTL
jgi:hypothetical protein